jgi:hypothetical protein
MDSRDTSTRILAIAGAALVWLALLAPLASPVWVLVQRAFFTLGLAGGGLLLWAALRSRGYRPYTAVSLGVAAASFALGRALTGAFGARVMGAAPRSEGLGTLVVAAYVAYLLALIALGVGGILLLRRCTAVREERLVGE